MHFDLRYAYLHILENGIRVHFNKQFYHPQKGINVKPVLSTLFSLREYGTWEECVIEAKKYRNDIAERALGDQFMRYGPMYRTRLSSANTSGHVGVSEREWGVFEAYWQENVDSAVPSIKKTKVIRANGHSEADRNIAFNEACDCRDSMVDAIYIPRLFARRKFVLCDVKARHDECPDMKKLLLLAA